MAQVTSPGYANLDTIRCGDTAECENTIAASDIDAFARLSLDVNPIHMDAGVARDYGFARPVAHGMLALGTISRLIGTELPGPGSLWVSQELQFAAPVLSGDRVISRVTVEKVSKAAGLVQLRTVVSNAETGAVVLSGVAKVKVLSRSEQR
jgi:acyl dehydratase